VPEAKTTDAAERKLTKAQAAALVRREVAKTDDDGKPLLKDGELVVRSVPVKANEVLAFKDYGDHVVVVTTDGRKLRGAKK